jgi:hypothetical protein
MQAGRFTEDRRILLIERPPSFQLLVPVREYSGFQKAQHVGVRDWKPRRGTALIPSLSPLEHSSVSIRDHSSSKEVHIFVTQILEGLCETRAHVLSHSLIQSSTF